jgi:hypothetical protein
LSSIGSFALLLLGYCFLAVYPWYEYRRSRRSINEYWNAADHMLIWCVCGTVLSLGWNAAFQYMQFSISESGNRSSINVSQYAVMLSNCGDVECDERQLEDFGRQYGDVVNTFFVRNFGRFLRKETQVTASSRSMLSR